MRRNIFPFSIPQANPSEKLKSIKEEISKFKRDIDYSLSSNKEYVILSHELKVSLRLKVWEKSFDEYKRNERGGEYYDNSYFFYKEGKFDGDPDIFEIKNEVASPQHKEKDFPQIMEIDDEGAEKINQENLKKKNNWKKDVEMVEGENFESSSSKVIDRRRDKEIKWIKVDDKLNTNHEKDNSHESGGGAVINMLYLFSL